MNGWLIVWSSPMSTARSSKARCRLSGGRNRVRGTRDSALRTRSSRIPFARTWRAMTEPGDSRGLGMTFLLEAEVLQLHLDGPPALPVVDRGMEGDRTEGPGLQRLAAIGHVPADRLERRLPLREPDLEVILPVADDLRIAHHPDAIGHQNRPRVADPVRLQGLDRLEHAEGQRSQRDLGVDLDRLLQLFRREGP